eukprot:scaffold1128_cov348-Pavlova_lutheri.AAC.5
MDGPRGHTRASHRIPIAMEACERDKERMERCRPGEGTGTWPRAGVHVDTWIETDRPVVRIGSAARVGSSRNRQDVRARNGHRSPPHASRRRNGRGGTRRSRPVRCGSSVPRESNSELGNRVQKPRCESHDPTTPESNSF